MVMAEMRTRIGIILLGLGAGILAATCVQPKLTVEQANAVILADLGTPQFEIKELQALVMGDDSERSWDWQPNEHLHKSLRIEYDPTPRLKQIDDGRYVVGYYIKVTCDHETWPSAFRFAITGTGGWYVAGCSHYSEIHTMQADQNHGPVSEWFHRTYITVPVGDKSKAMGDHFLLRVEFNKDYVY